VSRPLQPWKVGLVATMVAAFVAVLLVPAFQEFFAFDLPPRPEIGEALLTIAVAGAALSALVRLTGWHRPRDAG